MDLAISYRQQEVPKGPVPISKMIRSKGLSISARAVYQSHHLDWPKFPCLKGKDNMMHHDECGPGEVANLSMSTGFDR